MQWFFDAFAQSWAPLKIVVVILVIGLIIEALRPAERGQPLRNIAFNIGYVAFVFLINTLLLPPLMRLMQPLAQQYGLHIPIAFPDGLGWQILQVFAFFFIYDAFYYWFHRAQHTFGAAWPQHKLHHSEESLNVTTTLRHHWLEEPLRIWLILLPIGLLFDQKPVTVGWLAIAMFLPGYFVHLNVRLPFGPLTPIFAGPQWHRLHHSIEARHQDRNFAGFFPVFDIVFGTYSKPQRGEYPATGLHSRENLNSPLLATLSPFRDWRQMLLGERQPALAQSKQGAIESPIDEHRHGSGDQHKN